MELAAGLGVDLIITDHHELLPGNRKAVAVINPKQPDCTYPEKTLAGVGVAWNLARALYRLLNVPAAESSRLLDLVAVGTVADAVPLLGENRILVRHGLDGLKNCPSPGLAALAGKAGVNATCITAGDVSFALAPRLNAAGRLGDAGLAVKLLLAEPYEADGLADVLDALNVRRQQIESKMLEQAHLLAEERLADPALVLWHREWHPGVVGIVAGRLAQEYRRPVILVALGEEEGHGSARCVPGYNLLATLTECSGHLLRYGGHMEAAGITVAASQVEAFRDAFCHETARKAPTEEVQLPVVAEVAPKELTLELVRELNCLQPFGQGNPEPLFLSTGMDVCQARHVGKLGNHLQFKLRKDNTTLAGIYFRAGKAPGLPQCGDRIDTVFAVQENVWQGHSSLSLLVRDVRCTGEGDAGVVGIIDHRGRERDAILSRLARDQRLAVWVNTRAVFETLCARLPSENVTMIQRGQDVDGTQFDAVVFYHLPYDKDALEQFLSSLRFAGKSRFYLLYGPQDVLLNERIFTASIPGPRTMPQLAALLAAKQGEQVTFDRMRSQFPFPVTSHLVNRAIAILDELGITADNSRGVPVDQSQTYLDGRRILDVFRHYQNFWLQAGTVDLHRYLTDPERSLFPEGVTDYESGRFERAN
jgi:single-stranded-DNA-specific exonuclease